MTLGIFSRATDPVVFDSQMRKLGDKNVPLDKKCTIRKELLAAGPYIDTARRDQLFAYLEVNGSKKDKRRLKRLTSPKKNGAVKSP